MITDFLVHRLFYGFLLSLRTKRKHISSKYYSVFLSKIARVCALWRRNLISLINYLYVIPKTLRLLFALLLQGRHGFDTKLTRKKLMVDQATTGEVLLRILRFIPSALFQDKLTQPGKFQIKRTFFHESWTLERNTLLFLLFL